MPPLQPGRETQEPCPESVPIWRPYPTCHHLKARFQDYERTLKRRANHR
jgi:hypothetical protein